MKKFKKIMAVLVAAVLMIATMVPAWATTITITQDNTSGTSAGPETYSVYKVFDVTKRATGVGNTSNEEVANADKYTEIDEDVTTLARFQALQGDHGKLYSKSTDANGFNTYTEVADFNSNISRYYYMSSPDGVSYTILSTSPWFDKIQYGVPTQTWVTLEKTTATKQVTVSGSTVTADIYNVVWNDAKNYSRKEARDFAKWLYEHKPDSATATMTSDDEDEDDEWEATYSGDDGYYLISSSLGSELVLATSDITITTKNDYPTTSKDIPEDDYNIGDTVTFTITVTLPKTIDYTKPVIVHDTMDDCLALNTTSWTAFEGTSNNVKSKVTLLSDNEALTTAGVKAFSNHYGTVSGAPTTHATHLGDMTGKVAFDFYIDISGLKEATGEQKEKTITITYYAKLLSTAKISSDTADNPITNQEFVEYSKYKTTPASDTFKTFKFELEKKFDNPTSGDQEATFNLFAAEYVTDANGTYYRLRDGTYTTAAPSTEGTTEQQAEANANYESTTTKYKLAQKAASTAIAFVDNTSTTKYTQYKKADSDDSTVTTIYAKRGTEVSIEGLDSGLYCLRELTTAPGYNLLTKDVFVRINTDGSWEVMDPTDLYKIENTNNVTITNKTSTVLPTTGGMGTTVLYIVGGMLVILAGAYLFFSRKKTA